MLCWGSSHRSVVHLPLRPPHLALLVRCLGIGDPPLVARSLCRRWCNPPPKGQPLPGVFRWLLQWGVMAGLPAQQHRSPHNRLHLASPEQRGHLRVPDLSLRDSPRAPLPALRGPLVNDLQRWRMGNPSGITTPEGHQVPSCPAYFRSPSCVACSRIPQTMIPLLEGTEAQNRGARLGESPPRSL